MKLENRTNIIWPLKLKYRYFKKVPDWILTSFYFAIPALIVFLPFVILRWDILIKNDIALYLKLAFGALWALYGPLFMFRYDKEYIKFWGNLQSIYTGKDIEKLVKIYDLKIIRVSKLISLIWCVLITSVIIIDPSYLTIFGISGWQDPCLYIFVLFMFYLVHLTALGFTGAFITIKIIFNLIKSDSVKINEYDSDTVGGFSCFGNFSLVTTILFSTGVLFIPILYDYAIHSGLIAQLLIFLAVILYSIAIFLVFIIPVALAFKKADKDKEKIIINTLNRYKELRHKPIKTKLDHVEVLNEYNHLNYLKNLATYPFNFSTLLKITLTALFPILLYFLQMVLDPGSIFYNWKEVVEKIGINYGG